MKSLQRFSSEILWHFVGNRHKDDHEKNYCILSEILTSKTLDIGKNPEQITLIDGKEVKYYPGYPFSCLADIPLKDIEIHARRYGKFAIGFHRNNAIMNHFNPVLYTSPFSFVLKECIKLRDKIENKLVKTGDNETIKDFDNFMRYLGSFIKTANLSGEITDSALADLFQFNNYYYEREWRSLWKWTFSEQDIAVIIAEDSFIKRIKGEDFLPSEVVIMPYSYICKL